MTAAATPPAACDPRERAALLAQAVALGVPSDYGRRRGLRPIREPRRLVSIGPDIHLREQWLTPHAARAFARLRDAARDDGVVLQVVSAFRSIRHQLDIIARKRARDLSMQDILRVSAAPGYSEHHSGRAIDLTTPGFAALEEIFEHSPAFAWLQQHAGQHGFRLSYPRDNPHGIAYEPWHWCWHATRRAR